MIESYRRECDVSNLLGDELSTRYMQLLDSLRWDVEIGLTSLQRCYILRFHDEIVMDLVFTSSRDLGYSLFHISNKLCKWSVLFLIWRILEFYFDWLVRNFEMGRGVYVVGVKDRVGHTLLKESGKLVVGLKRAKISDA